MKRLGPVLFDMNSVNYFHTFCVFHFIRQAPKFKEFIQSMQNTFPVYLHQVYSHFTKKEDVSGVSFEHSSFQLLQCGEYFLEYMYQVNHR